MVEHFLGKEEVTSSILVNSSNDQQVALTAACFFYAVAEKGAASKGPSDGDSRGTVLPFVTPFSVVRHPAGRCRIGPKGADFVFYAESVIFAA